MERSVTTVLELHQSFLGEYLLCPERARQQWFKEVEDLPTDSTAIGTALHSFAEVILRDGSHGDAVSSAMAAWEYEKSLPGFRFVKVAKESTALKHIENACDLWLARVYPQLGHPLLVEYKFDFLFQELEIEGEHVEVRLAGAIDFADEEGLWDWKSASRMDKYTPGFGGEGWKLKRWGIQPTVYCHAASLRGGIDSWSNFTFAAVSKTNRTVQYLFVERGPEHARWLLRLTANVARMIVAGPPEWPLNDQHALCAPDWCPAYANCKGKALAGDAE